MLYPENSKDMEKLIQAANLLHQNDYTFTYKFMTTDTIGHGLLCGFHGNLHKEVILDRLKQEYQMSCMTTTPLIEYRAFKGAEQTYIVTLTPADINLEHIRRIDEPFINILLTIPNRYIDEVCTLIKRSRGGVNNQTMLPSGTTVILCYTPLYNAVNGLDNELMKRTNGYVNISYNDIFYEKSELKPLVFKAHNTIIHVCSLYAHKGEVLYIAQRILGALKENMSREQFHYNISAI